jgi:nitrogen regulation protein NR(I)
MSTPGRILLIEDDLTIADALRQVLTAEEFVFVHERRGDEGLRRARSEAFDVVLTDLKMPGLSGLELVRELHASHPRLPIILMTAYGTTEVAIEATRLGAFDYVLKPFDPAELIQLLRKAVTNSRLANVLVSLGDTASDRDAIVGNSRAMQTIYKEVGRIADKPVTVLIRGETGTGKELIARALWQYSGRAQAPFVAINCAAIPENLLESELFGHERGAFTGADVRRIGRFEQANGGTLFLDEIGDLTAGTQVKLLRVLQERCIQRVGGRETIPVDVRVIAATHRDLESAMAEGQFREDLFYRLSVVSLRLPPLRDRREDIAPLTAYFLKRYSAEFGFPSVPLLQPEALAALHAHAWPGNVRELENVIRKLLLLSRGYPITAEQVSFVLAEGHAPTLQRGQSLQQMAAELLAAAQRGEITDALGCLLQAAERELFSQAIAQAGGNQARAARWVGVSRLTMREKLRQFGLKPGDDPQSGENEK